ncbi:M20/M25/M40 family metallo-hydrolase [Bacillus sp. F19]|nr:M20/M25/M40 family metallo-hydrolase [Bacillus sp. F19]
MNSKWQSKQQLTELLTGLVNLASITGSKDEIALAQHLYYVLNDFPYFKENPDFLQLHPLSDGRYFLTALVKSKKQTDETVLLLSHFDVVDVKDYGHLQHLAFHPHELTKELLNSADLLPPHVKEDIETGDWLFGRGTMDMKAGLTVQLGMLERAMEGDFEGNLLLLTVPDEEVNSAGMLGAVPVLKDLKNQFNLSYRACVNSEPMFSRYPNDENYYVYSGSIGKVLAGFYCSGVETHVGEPFSGLNANLMVSELNRLLELNERYSEIVDDEVTPPPMNLMQKDLKEEYSVQIPHEAVTLFNILTMKRSMLELHDMLLKTAVEAAENIERFYDEKASRYSQSVTYTPASCQVTVMSYDDLLEYAVKKVGEAEVNRHIHYLKANRGALDDRHFTNKIVSGLSGLCKELAPLIVVFYSPPFYPSVSSKEDDFIQGILSEVQSYAKDQFQISLKNQQYFAGLSDLSFLQIRESEESIRELTANMPIYGDHYQLPLEEIKALNIPVLNVGPFGKDPHKWTERLHLPYSFETCPKLLSFTLKRIFEKK